MARINAILYDVNTVTRNVEQETERINHAIHTTMDRFDHTADCVRSNVRAKTSAVVGLARGVRVAIEWLLRSRHQAHET
jgi:hypothetical protein